jgi:hypothetical protein
VPLVTDDDGRHDFDFLFGTWDLRNRRLSKPLAGSDDWVEFGSTAVCRPLLGGLANYDEITIPGQRGGATLRTFDMATREWSLHWVTGEARLTWPPNVGVFRGSVGEFFGEDEWQGAQIRIRFTWRVHSHDSASWEQAFSADGGQTWETNWTNELTRTGD